MSRYYTDYRPADGGAPILREKEFIDRVASSGAVTSPRKAASGVGCGWLIAALPLMVVGWAVITWLAAGGGR